MKPWINGGFSCDLDTAMTDLSKVQKVDDDVKEVEEEVYNPWGFGTSLKLSKKEKAEAIKAKAKAEEPEWDDGGFTPRSSGQEDGLENAKVEEEVEDPWGMLKKLKKKTKAMKVRAEEVTDLETVEAEVDAEEVPGWGRDAGLEKAKAKKAKKEEARRMRHQQAWDDSP